MSRLTIREANFKYQPAYEIHCDEGKYILPRVAFGFRTNLKHVGLVNHNERGELHEVLLNNNSGLYTKGGTRITGITLINGYPYYADYMPAIDGQHVKSNIQDMIMFDEDTLIFRLNTGRIVIPEKIDYIYNDYVMQDHTLHVIDDCLNVVKFPDKFRRYKPFIEEIKRDRNVKFIPIDEVYWRGGLYEMGFKRDIFGIDKRISEV
ncbi:hypothetical protein HNP86_001765 [Methanococcus maripaludis]|uniref:Uncharacterized protein n=1 Tax=Methanococcus maripaludis TaxID=39152 RepID=A0A7J9P0N7_METMI|nr:hypothetical protein [Methanococcus maripaludis]MBA2851606.1 hypothetical protein [Methanococcus maripaludis]